MTEPKLLWCSKAWAKSADRICSHISGIKIVRCNPDEIGGELKDVVIIVPQLANITAEVMDAAPSLKLIIQAGVGLEGVDIDAATQRGIMVANVPSEVNRTDAAVAEMAILHMLVLTRRYNEALGYLKEGIWGQPMGTLLLTKTAGIVGMGGIGRALANRLKAFEMHVMGLDLPEAINNEVFRRKVGKAVDWLGETSQLEDLLRESDFVILCASVNESSRGIIGHKQLTKMKPSAYLINIARGPLVDQTALENALKEGRIAGAGLDVFSEEPLDPNSTLLQYNISVTPHIAGTTDIALDGVGRSVGDNFRRFLAGEPILNNVNSVELEKMGNRRRYP
jgi:phosphoglycerate dehydrogenase-like enzyme